MSCPRTILQCIICNHGSDPDHPNPDPVFMKSNARKSPPQDFSGVEKTTSFGGMTIVNFSVIMASRFLKQPFNFAFPVPRFPVLGNFICNHKVNW